MIRQCGTCQQHIDTAYFPATATDARGRLLDIDYAGPAYCSPDCREIAGAGSLKCQKCSLPIFQRTDGTWDLVYVEYAGTRRCYPTGKDIADTGGAEAHEPPALVRVIRGNGMPLVVSAACGARGYCPPSGCGCPG